MVKYISLAKCHRFTLSSNLGNTSVGMCGLVSKNQQVLYSAHVLREGHYVWENQWRQSMTQFTTVYPLPLSFKKRIGFSGSLEWKEKRNRRRWTFSRNWKLLRNVLTIYKIFPLPWGLPKKVTPHCFVFLD